jgi:hypothetical protein
MRLYGPLHVSFFYDLSNTCGAALCRTPSVTRRFLQPFLEHFSRCPICGPKKYPMTLFSMKYYTLRYFQKYKYRIWLILSVDPSSLFDGFTKEQTLNACNFRCTSQAPSVSVSIYRMLQVSTAGGGDSTAASDQKHEDGHRRRLRPAARRASLLLG